MRISLAFALLAGVSVGSARAATFTVNSTVDATDASPGDGICETAPGNGVCTLRAAVQESNASSSVNAIAVPAGVYRITLAGAPDNDCSAGDIDVNTSVTITGDSESTTIVDGGGATIDDNVFDLSSLSFPNAITLQGLTIRNGAKFGVRTWHGYMSTLAHVRILDNSVGVFNNGPLAVMDSTIDGNRAATVGGLGGGILVNSSDPIVVMRSTISNNAAPGSSGGGIAINTSSTVTVTNSTFWGNSATSGAAILVVGTLNLNNVTISGNSASDIGGGIFDLGTVTIQNTIVAGNSATRASPDCYMNDGVTMTSYGYNIVEDVSFCRFSNAANNGAGVNPMLGPLADNGGPTKTMAPLPGSLAIGHGSPSPPGSAPNNSCEVTDQRGLPRGSPGNGWPCTIGAYDEDGNGPADLAAPIKASDLSVLLDMSVPNDLSAPPDMVDLADDLSFVGDESVGTNHTCANSCGCSVGTAAHDEPAAFLALAALGLFVRRMRRSSEAAGREELVPA